ncbi:uncharacterized protein LOC142334073 isoform X3 [Lycorma delicatula]|uniref:uncharacterized protein LOC142334073 isoform X3 n=1 Tax=Lycorma delicatula TaxID=130591 RepID=UPI003F5141B1
MARLLSERPETSSNRSSTTSATSTNVKKMGDDETSLKNTWNINNEGPGSSNSLNTNFNNNKSIVTSRKLSFKLRNANTSTSSRPTFRATRVTISSNNVTALASKFNAVVIENNAQGRALLKKLNGGNHVPIKKPSKPVEGKVRAAVQHFETNRSNNYSEHRPKFVLVRKHSSNKYTNNNNRKSIAQSLNNKLDNVTEIEQDETKTLTASYQESEVKTKPKKKPNQRSIKTNLPQNPFSANPCFTTSTSINNSSESKFEIGNKNTDDKTDNDINKNSTETDLKSNNDDTFVVKCDSSTEVKEKDHHDKQNGIPIKYRIKDKKNNNNNNNNAVTKSKGKFRTCVLSSTGFYCVGDYETDDIDGSKGDKNYKATCIMQIGNDDNHVIIEEGYSKRQSSNNNSDTTVLMKNNKPKLQPKPNVIEINNVDLTKKKSSSSTSSSTSSLSKDCISEIKVDSLLHQDKKLSLAKDQSNLESALNEISLNTNINEESKTIKNTSVKPNRSFLWRNITSNKIEIKDIVKDIKDKESLIIAGVKHNVEAKLTNDSRLFQENNKKGDSLNGNDNDKQPTYMNGSVVCNLQHQKEFKNDESVKKEKCTTLTRNVSVNNNRKSSLYNCILQNSNDLQNDSTDGGLLNANKFRSTSSLTSFKKDQNIEEKENVLKRISLPSSTSPAINSTNTSTKIIYEEFENTLNNSVTSGSFLYKNIYITEARNEDILPIGAKNESVTVLNNYEEIQQNNSVTLTQALPYSPSYVESSKSSYGYVDPGNYEDLEDNYASINDNYDVNRENIYDDVINVKKDIQILINKETSGSSCGNELSHYESVYQTESCSAFEKDSDSSCDQSNSLYGITGCRPSSRSSSVSYHITGHGQPTPRSETSDEWVDVDNSGDEEILVYTERDRTRGRNVNGTGWCQKVRREWSKRANRSGTVSEENAPKRPPRSGNSSASWYSETEAFETSTNGSSENSFNRSNNSAWYTDSGLWDGSQTVTPDSGSENSSSHGSDLHLRFADEPLYQFYNATVTEKELNLCYSTTDKDNTGEPLDSDGYEEIGDHLISRPSAMELITPKYGHHRTLWCEIPQVLNSEILRTLTKEERKLQEAKFEVMTSEASYFKSLIVLEKHFAASPLLQDESVLSAKDRKSLFGCITPVRKCSEKLLSSLDKCWQESIMLAGICDIIHRHAIHYFQVYISYCSNQIDLNATLKKLKETNKKFEDTLAHLEADPKCESLSLHSFLMLPMQRITRMPLLVDAILSKLEISHPEYSSCQFALKTLNEFVQRCNEETRQQERVIEMMKLSSQLDFSKDVRTLPIVSKNRWLVRSGQVIQLNLDTRQTFGRRFTKSGSKITLFLFNDVLLLAKRKSNEDGYVVIDHCQKNLIQMNEEDDVVNNSSRYLIKLAMLKNHEGRLVEMFLSCDSETCRQRWMQAVAPPTSEIPGESIYESWDCPQVVGIHSYISVQPDELSLQKGDIINVLRKMTDGWYYGERTRDGEKGWFPGNHVHEIISSHVRARNLRQRYRLLVLSGSYLLEQQNNRKSVK